MTRRSLVAGLLLSLVTFAVAQDQDSQTVATETPSPKPPMVNPDFVRPLTLESFKLEIGLAALFLGYIFVWFTGSQANRSLASQWTSKYLDYIKEQFALVGKASEKDGLTKDGPSDYVLYTSGRRNVQFAHWWIKLKPRSDLLTWILKIIFSAIGMGELPSDRVEVDALLSKEVNTPFVFAILPVSNAKSIRDERYDLRTFTKLSDAPKLPFTFAAYSESQKLTELIMASKIGQVIRSCPGFRSLIISSQPAVEPETYGGDKDIFLQLSFDLSAGQEMIELACEIPDIIAGLQLSQDIKSKLRKNREELEKKAAKLAAEQRAEELARKKAEAKKAEAERVAKLSPSEQRKWEEKERARELKKSQKKRTKRI